MVGNIIPWFEEYTITSVGDFLEHLPERSLEYPWGYRGLPMSSYDLKPSLFRDLVDMSDENNPVEKAWGYRNLENLLLNKFKAYARPHLTFAPDCDLAWLALGQHFGLPTRLLDWTENPLVAMFFALKDLTDEDAIVWACLTPFVLRESVHTLNRLDKDILEYKHRDSPSIEVPSNGLPPRFYRYHPSHTTNRITAQQGFFTIQSFWAENVGELYFLSLEEQFEMNLFDPAMVSGMEEPGLPKFKKYTIPRANKTAIQKQLDVFGMNHYAIFPDLEGVAKKLREDVRLEKRF